MRRISILAAASALLVSSTLSAQQTPPPPAAPVSVSASLKEAHFDWNPVPGAYTYWLLRKPWNQGQPSYYTRIGDRIPAGRTHAAIPISAHLQWDDTYTIAACNTAGCTRTFDLYFDELRIHWIGYVKASNTNAGDRFGADVVISADGSTMAVSAQGEDSDATGVNGD
jgi:trimeric autotransporter adhesin